MSATRVDAPGFGFPRHVRRASAVARVSDFRTVAGTERGGAVVLRRRKVERMPLDCWCGKQCIGGPDTVACRKGYATYVSICVERSKGARRIPASPAAMLARYSPLSPKPMRLPIGARRSVRIVGARWAGALCAAPVIGNPREAVRAMQSGTTGWHDGDALRSCTTHGWAGDREARWRDQRTTAHASSSRIASGEPPVGSSPPVAVRGTENDLSAMCPVGGFAEYHSSTFSIARVRHRSVTGASPERGRRARAAATSGREGRCRVNYESEIGKANRANFRVSAREI